MTITIRHAFIAASLVAAALSYVWPPLLGVAVIFVDVALLIPGAP